jgi:hypothetical protein
VFATASFCQKSLSAKKIFERRITVKAGTISRVNRIPSFIAITKNNQEFLSFSLGKEKAPIIKNRSFVNQSFPSLIIKIDF